MPKAATKPALEKQEGLSAVGYAIAALIGLLFAIGLLLFYVYQVPRMVQSGVQNQVFYILLLPWGLSCAAFLFGAMRSIAKFTHKRMGGALELGGPVVLFCLVVAGGFKLVPSAPEAFDLTVRAHSATKPVIKEGKITIDLDNTRRTEEIASNGEANFKGIPAKFRGTSVKVLAQGTGYKEDWQTQKLSGSTLDLLLEPLPRNHLNGTIIPPPENWNKLRVAIEGQQAEAKVDEQGRFDIPAIGANGDKVPLHIYDGTKLVYDEFSTLPGPVSIRLHPELAGGPAKH